MHNEETTLRVCLVTTQGRYLDTAAAAAKLLQSCPTLCDPIDSSPPGSPILGILQARVLEWGAIAFSNAWKWKVKVKSLGCVRLVATPWTAAYQAPPSMGFSRQEYWSRVSLPSPFMYQCHTILITEDSKYLLIHDRASFPSLVFFFRRHLFPTVFVYLSR